jgi:hypothetical protein
MNSLHLNWVSGCLGMLVIAISFPGLERICSATKQFPNYTFGITQFITTAKLLSPFQSNVTFYTVSLPKYKVITTYAFSLSKNFESDKRGKPKNKNWKAGKEKREKKTVILKSVTLKDQNYSKGKKL